MEKTALITGGSTGIGRAIAVGAAAEGYRVILVGRNKNGLEKTGRIVTGAGGKELSIVCDLSDPDQVRELIGTMVDIADTLDLIVNAAGIWHGTDTVYAGTDITDFDPQVIYDTYMVGVVTPTILAHGLVPIMPEGSSIINVSGTFAGGAKGWVPYFVSKRALEDLTVGLSEELDKRKIRVCCISPADTATDALKQFFPDDAKDANSPVQVARAVMDLVQNGKNGEFRTIRNGNISVEGYHR